MLKSQPWRGLILLLLGAFFLSSLPCCREKSEDDVLIGLINSLRDLAERKDLEAIMTYFAEDFLDFEGRTKAGLKSLLGGYLAGRTGIVVHLLSTRISRGGTAQATLQTEVALSSGGAEALRRLVKISPDNYRITIDLVKEEGRWLIQYAEWSDVGLGELYPESLTRLKKIFPKSLINKN